MFSSLRIVIIQQINAFVEDVSKQADGLAVGLCLSKSEGIPGLNDLFPETGLSGLL